MNSLCHFVKEIKNYHNLCVEAMLSNIPISFLYKVKTYLLENTKPNVRLDYFSKLFLCTHVKICLSIMIKSNYFVKQITLYQCEIIDIFTMLDI